MIDERKFLDGERISAIKRGFRYYKKYGRLYKSCEKKITWQNSGCRLAQGKTIEEVVKMCKLERPDLV